MEIAFTDDQVAALQELAAAQGQSIDAIVYDAIDWYLRREANRQKALADLDAAAKAIQANIPPGISPEEIERDITDASKEYWETQRTMPGH